MLDAHPEWWRHFVALALSYGDTAALAGADLLIAETESRLIAVLLRFAGARSEASDAGGMVSIPVTQQDLAGAANLSRNWTGTILRRLAKRGLVETKYNGITLVDQGALQAILEKVGA
ncbi:Crp/Fnr family transcriptional regulator [Lutimaribacter marinistellae]|uniref:Crp/Fnr family transcriptional regulator n=2 Tax=Lutimaribacter marinistellae TaxID=1820329 RepID=A0ABV7TCM9_9RHOB